MSKRMSNEGLGELLHLQWAILEALGETALTDLPKATAFTAAAAFGQSVEPEMPELDFDFPFPTFDSLPKHELGS